MPWPGLALTLCIAFLGLFMASFFALVILTYCVFSVRTFLGILSLRGCTVEVGPSSITAKKDGAVIREWKIGTIADVKATRAGLSTRPQGRYFDRKIITFKRMFSGPDLVLSRRLFQRKAYKAFISELADAQTREVTSRELESPVDVAVAATLSSELVDTRAARRAPAVMHLDIPRQRSALAALPLLWLALMAIGFCLLFAENYRHLGRNGDGLVLSDVYLWIALMLVGLTVLAIACPSLLVSIYAAGPILLVLSLRGCSIDIEPRRVIVSKRGAKRKEWPIGTLDDVVASRRGLTFVEFRGSRRVRDIVIPRWLFQRQQYEAVATELERSGA